MEAKAETKKAILSEYLALPYIRLWNILISHWLSLRNVDVSCAEDFIQVLCDTEKAVDGHLSESNVIAWWYQILYQEAAIALSLPKLG